MRGDRGRPVKRTWEKFAWDESIEHIYPQSPHAQWSDDVTVATRSKRAKSAITNSLGNLLL
ncbi:MULTISPECIES: GmrSD restriction endonuclease domain-containing protein [Comamonas]|uniref:GmrSD restriction endonuclease domain-containing protein n=1 Tax=Comamonas TaxID=283 RepID=UPI00351E498B